MMETEQAAATVPTSAICEHGSRFCWQLIVLLVLIGAIYYPILGSLALDWWLDPNFSHGFFVPLFSVYVLWQRRTQLAEIAARPSWAGLAVIIGSLCMLLTGVFGAELFLSRASFVLLLGGLLIFFWGLEMFRAVLFPWAFLFLMIPIPSILFNEITFPLQLLASRLAAELLPVMHVPVLCEGNIIQLPGVTLEVAEACSGIRSLLTLGTLAIIYGYFLEGSVWRRVMLVIAAVPIAVAANALRVVTTGMLAQYWNAEKALGLAHEFSGWVMFLVALALLFALHRLIRLIPSGESTQP